MNLFLKTTCYIFIPYSIYLHSLFAIATVGKMPTGQEITLVDLSGFLKFS